MEALSWIRRVGPSFNSYVLVVDRKVTVIDAALPEHWYLLLDVLEQMGLSIGNVEAVILTHAHADHIGFAERLRRTVGAKVWVHEADLERTRQIGTPSLGFLINIWRPFVIRLAVGALRLGLHKTPRIEQAETFQDGEKLDVPGNPLVIHTPGHTEGHCAFYLPARRVLFTGDALLTINLLTGKHAAPRVPYRHSNVDAHQAHQSIEKLFGLGEALVLPGHGEPWKGDMVTAVRGAQDSRLLRD